MEDASSFHSSPTLAGSGPTGLRMQSTSGPALELIYGAPTGEDETGPAGLKPLCPYRLENTRMLLPRFPALTGGR
jgi:hypothetical protein